MSEVLLAGEGSKSSTMGASGSRRSGGVGIIVGVVASLLILLAGCSLSFYFLGNLLAFMNRASPNNLNELLFITLVPSIVSFLIAVVIVVLVIRRHRRLRRASA